MEFGQLHWCVLLVVILLTTNAHAFPSLEIVTTGGVSVSGTQATLSLEYTNLNQANPSPDNCTDCHGTRIGNPNFTIQEFGQPAFTFNLPADTRNDSSTPSSVFSFQNEPKTGLIDGP